MAEDVRPGEGTIKYQCDFTHNPELPYDVKEINAWRRVLYLLGILGQDPNRYGGCGYGNVSQRISCSQANRTWFIITGTQTDKIEYLTPHHYSLVTEYYPEENRVVAEGPVEPSSECMTHGTIYDFCPDVKFVFHVHSPEIWKLAKELDIPLTSEIAGHGTPEMAKETGRLLKETDAAERGIIAMGRHEDGLVSFGKTAEEAVFILVRHLVKSLQYR